MGRADQRNGTRAMWSVAINIITQECIWMGGKETNKLKPALAVLKQLISSFWNRMAGICLDVQKWLLSRGLLKLRAGIGLGCWICCHLKERETEACAS